MLDEADTTEFAEWSPDSSRIVVSISVDSGVWVVPASGRGGRRITPPSQVFWSTWSPDGRQLAYVYNGELWVVNADGTGPRALISGVGAGWKPLWSPDGHRIAFQTQEGWGDGGAKVMIVNSDGSQLRVLSVAGDLVDYFRRT